VTPSSLEPGTAAAPGRRFQRPAATRVIGYASVSARLRGSVGSTLQAQTAEIEAACQSQGLQLVEMVHDVDRGNGRSRERPALDYALERIAAGQAGGLVVCALECLSRWVVDLGEVVDWFTASSARLIALDLGLDTATPEGRLAARALSVAGGLESQRIRERTMSGLAAARRKGGPSGRPAVSDRPELRERIVRMRAEGMTLQAIADRLNADGVPTLRGGTRWRPSSVHSAAGYKRRDPKRMPPRGGGAPG